MRLTRVLAVVAMGTLVAAAFAVFQADAGKKGNQYVGVKRCARCHDAKKSGKQVSVWKKKPHANAFKVLSTAEAKKVAKKLGISNPTKDSRCLKCHDTAEGKKASQLAKSFVKGQGVQCEDCHGPGEKHFRIRFEEQQEGDDDDDDDDDGELLMSLPRGEVAKITEKTCTRCHNKDSPTYKPFCFCERMAEIAHWDPRKEKARGKKAYSKQSCKCK